MNTENYTKNRAECWEEYCETHPLCNTPVMRMNFDWTFSRAYALGKEKEAITQEDVEKAAEKFADDIKIPASIPGIMVPFINGIAHDSYLQGAQDFLGKQQKDTDDCSLWSRLTDDEKREMQCRYHTNECVLRDHRKRTGYNAQSKAVARMKLLEDLFGKENLKVENK